MAWTLVAVLVIAGLILAALWRGSDTELQRCRAELTEHVRLWTLERDTWQDELHALQRLIPPADTRVLRPALDPDKPCCAFCGKPMPEDAVRYHTGIYLHPHCKSVYHEATR